MPYAAYVLLYLVLEALAFWGVSQLIGVGWALLGVFVLMAVGAVGVSGALRAEMARASHGNATIGQFAGGTALALAGGALTVIPGYLTSAVGVLLLFRPTRELVRSMMASSLQKRVEDFGVRVYDISSAGRAGTSYGTFGDGNGRNGSTAYNDGTGYPGDIIDDASGDDAFERDIEQWSKNARPEDFGGTGEK